MAWTVEFSPDSGHAIWNLLDLLVGADFQLLLFLNNKPLVAIRIYRSNIYFISAVCLVASFQKAMREACEERFNISLPWFLFLCTDQEITRHTAFMDILSEVLLLPGLWYSISKMICLFFIIFFALPTLSILNFLRLFPYSFSRVVKIKHLLMHSQPFSYHLWCKLSTMPRSTGVETHKHSTFKYMLSWFNIFLHSATWWRMRKQIRLWSVQRREYPENLLFIRKGILDHEQSKMNVNSSIGMWIHGFIWNACSI